MGMFYNPKSERNQQQRLLKLVDEALQMTRGRAPGWLGGSFGGGARCSRTTANKA